MTRRFLICAAIALLASGSANAQGCGDWTQVLIQSFLPKQVDESAIREISTLSPDQYFTAIRQKELEGLAHETNLQAVSLPDVDPRLRTALARFYEAGFRLYGVRFDANKLGISPAADVNAFASGSHVFMNQGLLLYFQHPLEYLTQIGALPARLSPQDYYRVKLIFNWENDWDGIYFVLAHEASHNLMRHRDQHIFENINGLFGDYRQAVLDHRKSLAEGHGGGFGRYMWRSTLRFFESFQQGEKQRELESEADIVGMTVLRAAGFDPAISISAGEKMALLVGGAPQVSGFNASMTHALCSTHPDWIARISTMQQNLGCIRFMGRPCNQRVTYPVEDNLQKLRTGISQLQQYEDETLRIAELTSTGGANYEVELDLNPKDADIEVDGRPASRGRVALPVGKHALAASKPGYVPQAITFVVFPDVRAKVKLKLKKQ